MPPVPAAWLRQRGTATMPKVEQAGQRYDATQEVRYRAGAPWPPFDIVDFLAVRSPQWPSEFTGVRFLM